MKPDYGAAFFSLIFPGLGQMMQGRTFAGIFIFIGVIAGYVLFFIPGLILHILNTVDAAHHRPKEKTL